MYVTFLTQQMEVEEETYDDADSFFTDEEVEVEVAYDDADRYLQTKIRWRKSPTTTMTVFYRQRG